jgi:glycosyltransferase involved in cell wall biosynthesis
LIATFGRDRPYKGVNSLASVFREIEREDPSISLLLAGQSVTAWSERVSTLDAPVDDAQLVDVIAAADLLVFPYRDVLHSGSVILALGFGRPVLAPDLGSLPELQGQIGERWLRLYEPPLTAEDLTSALGWLREPRPMAPVVSELSWTDIASRVVPLYR